MSNVISLANQRGKHDDGRCHEPTCAWRGEFRYLCPYRGQHPQECPHTETYVHHYKLHGFIDCEVIKCKACDRAVYPDVPLGDL